MEFPSFEPINLKDNTQSINAIDLLLTQIKSNSNQPRKIFDKELLDELASSIRQHGILQPIIVNKLDKDGKYQIIAGERRWRAAKMAGLEKIPAIIKDYDKANKMAVALIENIQRENLNPLEEAEAIQSLLNECYMTHSQVAENLGRSRASVTNLLRLLALSSKVKGMVNAGLLEMGHARALLSLTVDQQIVAAEVIIKKSLSVRGAENLVQRINISAIGQGASLPQQYDKQIEKWGEQLSKKFLSIVDFHIKPNGKAKIVFNFDSIEEVELFIERAMA